MAVDIKLDPVTWQPVLKGGDLQFVTGDEELVQHIGIQAKTIVGECFQDPTAGLLDKKRMFGRQASESYFRAKFTAKVESNPEIAKGSCTLAITLEGKTRVVKWAARKANGDPLRGRVSLRVA